MPLKIGQRQLATLLSPYLRGGLNRQQLNRMPPFGIMLPVKQSLDWEEGAYSISSFSCVETCRLRVHVTVALFPGMVTPTSQPSAAHFTELAIFCGCKRMKKRERSFLFIPIT
jgi:hypothetical protein